MPRPSQEHNLRTLSSRSSPSRAGKRLQPRTMRRERGRTSDATCRSCRSEWLLCRVASNAKDREAVGGPRLISPDWSVEAFIEMGEGAWPWYSDCDCLITFTPSGCDAIHVSVLFTDGHSALHGQPTSPRRSSSAATRYLLPATVLGHGGPRALAFAHRICSLSRRLRYREADPRTSDSPYVLIISFLVPPLTRLFYFILSHVAVETHSFGTRPARYSIDPHDTLTSQAIHHQALRNRPHSCLGCAFSALLHPIPASASDIPSRLTLIPRMSRGPPLMAQHRLPSSLQKVGPSQPCQIWR